MTEDEIDRRFVPRTAAERRQAARARQTEAGRLQEAVVRLQRQVDQLQWKVFGTNQTEQLTE